MSKHREPAEPEPLPVAYSYVRFSDPSQAAGDSLRRQIEKAAEWCKSNNVRLDTTLTLRDLGKSAFRGKHRENPDRHALAAFLRLVEQSRVPRGSYLVVEALDRLTREDIQPALLLVLGLLQAGVRLVQLIPAFQVYTDKSGPHEVMLMIVELMRGHSESKAKSERVGAAWIQRRKKARERNGVLTRRLPAWVEERGGKLVLIPERAAVVRRIFEMASTGHGLYAIMTRLNEEGVKPFGPSGHWSISYLHLILKDRRALGELQPMRGSEPDGPVLRSYFPAVVDEATWLRARAGAAERHKKPGKVSANVNVFQGLVRGARNGVSYTVGMETGRGRPYRTLRSTAPRSGRGHAESFPLDTFERAILSCLHEINPHEILNGDQGPDATTGLAAELAGVEARIAELENELLQGDVPALARVLRQLEGRRRDLAAQLAEARQQAAHPLSESWGEVQSLIDTVGNAPDPRDARLRLRSALRRIVDSIRLLVVPRGRDRLAVAQLIFQGRQKVRTYFIAHRPPKANAAARTPGSWWVGSLDAIDGIWEGFVTNEQGIVTGTATMEAWDLRQPDDVPLVEHFLATCKLPPAEAKGWRPLP
jgi:DNA invertase Pin-like site-specific DNA recombinase